MMAGPHINDMFPSRSSINGAVEVASTSILPTDQQYAGANELPQYATLLDSPKKKKPRTALQEKTRVRKTHGIRNVFNSFQLLELNKEFHLSWYPPRSREDEIASNLNMTAKQVRIWFQNRRAQGRKLGQVPKYGNYGVDKSLDSGRANAGDSDKPDLENHLQDLFEVPNASKDLVNIYSNACDSFYALPSTKSDTMVNRPFVTSSDTPSLPTDLENMDLMPFLSTPFERLLTPSKQNNVTSLTANEHVNLPAMNLSQSAIDGGISLQTPDYNADCSFNQDSSNRNNLMHNADMKVPSTSVIFASDVNKLYKKCHAVSYSGLQHENCANNYGFPLSEYQRSQWHSGPYPVDPCIGVCTSSDPGSTSSSNESSYCFKNLRPNNQTQSIHGHLIDGTYDTFNSHISYKAQQSNMPFHSMQANFQKSATAHQLSDSHQNNMYNVPQQNYSIQNQSMLSKQQHYQNQNLVQQQHQSNFTYNLDGISVHCGLPCNKNIFNNYQRKNISMDSDYIEPENKAWNGTVNNGYFYLPHDTETCKDSSISTRV